MQYLYSDAKQLAQKRRKYVRLLQKSLNKAVKKIIKEMKDEVKKISLFGSYPERADLFSDLDLLIIMKTRRPFLERLTQIYSLLHLPIDADILCYTPEEIKRLEQRPFWRNIKKKEIVLYEKKSLGRRKKMA